MNSLISRNSFLNDFFGDVAPGFYVRPLPGDALPTAAQIKGDIKENEQA